MSLKNYKKEKNFNRKYIKKRKRIFHISLVAEVLVLQRNFISYLPLLLQLLLQSLLLALTNKMLAIFFSNSLERKLNIFFYRNERKKETIIMFYYMVLEYARLGCSI